MKNLYAIELKSSGYYYVIAKGCDEAIQKLKAHIICLDETLSMFDEDMSLKLKNEDDFTIRSIEPIPEKKFIQ